MREITDIKEIQMISLEILKFIDKICRKNKITYSICGGTLLGAIRHKGFIPWDDDIDIMMPRPEYERFLQIMDEDSNTNNKYKCLHYGKEFPNYYYRFAKVVDLSTKLEESTLINNDDLGIFVDVFPVDGIDNKKAKKYVKKSTFYARMLDHSCRIKTQYKNVPFFKYLIKKFILTPISKIFGSKYWLKKHENYVKSFNTQDFEYGNLYSGGSGIKEMFPIKYFSDLTEIKFEDSVFFAIKEYDKYLCRAYGDYMALPPPEKRVTHHDFKIYKK